MKKYLFLVATLLLTVSMSVSAQNNNGRGNPNNRRSDNMVRMSVEERVNQMTKELDLTEKEAADVLALCKKHEEQRTAEVAEHRSKRGTGAANRDVSREEFRKMREEKMKEQQAELENIIGKEKVEKWNKLRQEVRDTNRAGRRDSQGQRGLQNRNN